jgi:hypothetical protein
MLVLMTVSAHISTHLENYVCASICYKYTCRVVSGLFRM